MSKYILSGEIMDFIEKKDGGLEIIQKYRYTKYVVSWQEDAVFTSNDTLDYGFRFKSEDEIHWGFQSYANALACAHIFADKQLQLLENADE